MQTKILSDWFVQREYIQTSLEECYGIYGCTHLLKYLYTVIQIFITKEFRDFSKGKNPYSFEYFNKTLN